MVYHRAVLPDHRRVEALLDRRPHPERRREDLVAVVVGDHQVGAVAGAELVDLAEQVVGGVPREHVREAGLDARSRPARADRRSSQSARRARTARRRACTPVCSYGASRVGPRQRHRHVEVVGARRERAAEDRHVEHRVDGVHHVRDAVLAAQRAPPTSADARVDLRGGVPARRRTPPPSRPWRRRSRRPRSSRRSRGGPRSAANADPTPPAPTSRILMLLSPFPERRLRCEGRSPEPRNPVSRTTASIGAKLDAPGFEASPARTSTTVLTEATRWSSTAEERGGVSRPTRRCTHHVLDPGVVLEAVARRGPCRSRSA